MISIMDSHTADYVASKAMKIYRLYEKDESGTTGFEEHTDFCGTHFDKNILVRACFVKDWEKSPYQKDIWTYKSTRILESGTLTATTEATLPEYTPIVDRPIDSSTSDEGFLREDLSKIIRLIFDVGKNEQFEDGMKSKFSFAIENLISNFQDHAIEMLSEFITQNKIDSDILCETLRTLGNLHDDVTELSRFQILIPFLSHTSPYIRDCTGLALYDLESPNAIPYIKEAIEKESIQSLKNDFVKVINDLKELNSAQVDSST